MIRKNKLLICTLLMSMVISCMPGMKSEAAELSGEEQVTASLQDENSQRLEETTAMDEDGRIYEISEEEGIVAEETPAQFAMFSARSLDQNKVVNFNTKGSATTSFTYSGGNGYTNGAYGADAAYLGMTNDGKVRFMLSGVTGTVNASEVQIVEYESVSDCVSYYGISDGKLIHYISQDLNRAPSSYINNGTAPAYLSEGVKYYSYDGHYFYTDYKVMLSDYQNHMNGQNAVNAGNAFYNYFQFKNMREASAYSGEELNTMLQSAMGTAGVNASLSKLTGTGTAFVKYQNLYQVNALLSIGIAVNESGWGLSWICQNKNNIFGLNAVDSDPGVNADTYASIDDCIRIFMKTWMDGGYFDASDWRNHGTYLGDKNGGINVSYASDPYWGEKAAAHAWNLDSVGGKKDGPMQEETPSEPETDGTQTPTVPDVPSEPETDGTQTPTVPDVPSEPETDGTQTPTIPNVPSEPETDGTQTPTVPNVPSEPETDGTQTPTIPNVPSEPETDGTQTPTIPNAPSEPETDGTQTPDILDVPSEPEANGTVTPETDETNTSNAPDTEGTKTQDLSAESEKTQSTLSSGGESSENQTPVPAPKTGDTDQIVIWFSLLGLSLIFGTAAAAGKKRSSYK